MKNNNCVALQSKGQPNLAQILKKPFGAASYILIVTTACLFLGQSFYKVKEWTAHVTTGALHKFYSVTLAMMTAIDWGTEVEV